MFCTSCATDRLTNARRLNLSKYNINGNIFRFDCTHCNKFIALKAENEILNFDQVLTTDNISYWKEISTPREKLVYYVLSQIIYPERDPPKPNKWESTYDFADETDKVMLRWEQGKAVGFFTVKPKGSRIAMTHEEYVMPMLDTAYVRSEYRNRGIGMEILMNISEIYPDSDIGFSRPISDGMLKVLKKFLTANRSARSRFWEIENGGGEGDQRLIWFLLKKQENQIYK